jgi:hypothetical protein
MEKHYIIYHHSTPFFSEWPAIQFFSFSQYTSDVIVVICCVNFTIGISFLSQKTFAISFLADNVRLNFFGFYGECVYNHCFDCSLVSRFRNETQVSITCYSYDVIEKFVAIFVISLQKVKAEVIL